MVRLKPDQSNQWLRALCSILEIMYFTAYHRSFEIGTNSYYGRSLITLVNQKFPNVKAGAGSIHAIKL